MADEAINIPIEYTAKTGNVSKALNDLSKKTRDAINAGNVNNSSIAKLSTQLAKAQLELDKTSQKLKSLEFPTGDFVSLERKIDLTNQSISKTKQLIESNNNELQETKLQYDTIKQKIEQLNSKKNLIMQPYIEKSKIMSQLQDTRNSIKEQMAKINEEIKITPKGKEQDALIQKFNELNQELTETTSKLYSIAGSVGALTKTTRPQVAAIYAEINKLEPELRELESKMNSSQGQVTLLTQKLSEQETQLKSYEQSLQELRESGKEAFIPPESESEADVYIAKIRELTAKIEELEAKLKELQDNPLDIDTSKLNKLVFVLSTVQKGLNLVYNSLNKAVSAVLRFGKSLAKLPFIPLLRGLKNLHSRLKTITSLVSRMMIRRLFYLAFQALVKFTKDSVQQLAKFSKTFNKSVSEMISSFQYLGRNLVSSVTPIVEAITPLVVNLVDKLTEAVIKANALLSTLTGKKQMIIAKKQQYDYAESLDATAKAAEKAAEKLGYYDKLNVIGQENQNTQVDVESPFVYQEVDADSWINDFIKQFKKAWKSNDFKELDSLFYNFGKTVSNKIKTALDSINWDNIITTGKKLSIVFTSFLRGIFTNTQMWESIGRTFGKSLNTITTTLWNFVYTFPWKQAGKAFASSFNAFIKTLNPVTAAQSISKFIKGLLDTAITFLENLDTKALGTAIGTFFANIDWWGIIKRVFKLIGLVIKTVFKTFFTSLSTFFSESTTSSKVLFFIVLKVITTLLALKAAIKGISIAISLVKFIASLPALITGFTQGISILGSALGGLFGFIKTVGGALVKGIIVAGKGLLAFFTSPAGIITLIIAAIVALAIIIIKNRDKIKLALDIALAKVKEIVGKIIEKVNNLKDKVVDAFNKIKTGILNVWEGIKSGIKGAVNWILGKIENFINGMISAINWFTSKVNNITGILPDWAGGSKLQIRQIGYVQIPRLAQGAVIPPNKEFLAMLGDQKKGYNIETPLDTMIEAFETALDNRGNDGTSTIILQLDRREVARIVYDSMEKKYKQTGRFIKGVEV